MDKFQLKANRQKHKTVETGVMMGQTTNAFSQLSATYLQNKGASNKDQEQFLQQTQIVEYYNPTINRLCALLRKKAEVTKVKAVLQLKEEVMKMSAEDVAEFAPTFAHLFSYTIINQPSRQVAEQFVHILTYLLTEHRKIILGEITTLYAPMLIFLRTHRTASLLFKGTEEEQLDKAFLLFMKPQSQKKFFITLDILLDSVDNLQAAHVLNNICSLMKIIKDIIRIHLKSNKLELNQFVTAVWHKIIGKCTEQCMKSGGRCKAALLELYAVLLKDWEKWGIDWQYIVKIISNCFLDKDQFVQACLWKHCHFTFLCSLKEEGSFNQFFSHSEDKIIQCIGIGGIAMYRELPHYLQYFPSSVCKQEQTHKSIINKIAFIRKITNKVIEQDDETQTRLKCYYQLVRYFITSLRALKYNHFDQKKVKEISMVCSKAQKQFIHRLQQKYYQQPINTKNPLSHSIPTHFAALLHQFGCQFTLVFNPTHTFALCEPLKLMPTTEKVLNELFQYCKTDSSLILKYLQTFSIKKFDVLPPTRDAAVDAKIFLLTAAERREQWFMPDWDAKKSIIAYDPRITLDDLDAYEFTINKTLASNYDRPEYDGVRFDFFVKNYQNQESCAIMKYLIPFMKDYLIKRNEGVLSRLKQLWEEEVELLKASKWVIGEHRVLKIRILNQLFIHCFNMEGREEDIIKTSFFGNICQFCRIIHSFKMQKQFLQLCKVLKKSIQQKQSTFTYLKPSIEQSIFSSYINLMSSKQQFNEKEQRIRANRLKRCTQYIQTTLWYLVPKAKAQTLNAIFLHFCSQDRVWANAANRYEPWLIGQCIFQKAQLTAIQRVVHELIDKIPQYYSPFCYFLNFNGVIPLKNHENAKNLYSNIQLAILQRIMTLHFQKKLAFIEKIISFVSNTNCFSHSQGMQLLVAKIIEEGVSKQEESSIARICLGNRIQRLSYQNPFQIIVFRNLVQIIPLDTIQNIQQRYKELYSRLSGEKQIYNYCKILSICNVFWRNKIGLKTLNQQKEININEIIEKLIQKSFQEKQNDIIELDFIIFTLFQFVNVVLEQQIPTPTLFDDKLLKLFLLKSPTGTPFHCLTQTSKVTFAFRLLQRIEQKQKSFLIQRLAHIACDENTYYQKLLLQMQQQQITQFPLHYQDIIRMFIQISQFLLRAAAYLSLKIILQQQIVLRLLQCPFSGFKKAAFVFLRQLYRLRLGGREPPNAFVRLLSLQLDNTDALSYGTVDGIATYMYVWQALLIRRECMQRSEEDQDSNFSFQDFIQSNQLARVFLQNFFTIVDNKLKFQKNQVEYSLHLDDLLKHDSFIQYEEKSTLKNKILHMTMKTFYQFVNNFPMFLREYVDENKKHRQLCERILRQYISDAIFTTEVEKIEIRSSEWNDSGKMGVYVNAKMKEIYAEYTHDVLRIGLRMLMKGTYPLTPITVEVGENLKMEESNRWLMMLKTQLHNRNNTIINGIILWKENIDKKLAGVEECFICYEIVNVNGNIPKKACKTCKKKFHGNCILKWFTKSNKSQCPLCKSQFL